MTLRAPTKPRLHFAPLTPERWSDFERLFGERGACGGCWCMVWRRTRGEFERNKGEGNRRAMRAIVESGQIPGILAFAGRTPIGWCAVAPREAYPVLARSRVLKPLDDRPVWSISCLFVDKAHRGQGVSVALLKAAADYVRRQGGRILEGYPVVPRSAHMPDVFAWTGVLSAFQQAGFTECPRRSATRPIMRRTLRPRVNRSQHAPRPS